VGIVKVTAVLFIVLGIAFAIGAASGSLAEAFMESIDGCAEGDSRCLDDARITFGVMAFIFLITGVIMLVVASVLGVVFGRFRIATASGEVQVPGVRFTEDGIEIDLRGPQVNEEGGAASAESPTKRRRPTTSARRKAMPSTRPVAVGRDGA
jgi:hypothetical protein